MDLHQRNYTFVCIYTHLPRFHHPNIFFKQQITVNPPFTSSLLGPSINLSTLFSESQILYFTWGGGGGWEIKFHDHMYCSNG